MTPKALILNQLETSKWLFDKFIADLTDDDARFQPNGTGNHLNWMLAHLAVSADGMMSKLSGQAKALSENLHKEYAGGSTCRTDDGMTRGEAVKLFNEAHTRTVEFVKTFDESRYDEKAPEGFPPNFPNAGAVVGLLATHPYWHFGQLTVNRTLLGKPRILG